MDTSTQCWALFIEVDKQMKMKHWLSAQPTQCQLWKKQYIWLFLKVHVVLPKPSVQFVSDNMFPEVKYVNPTNRNQLCITSWHQSFTLLCSWQHGVNSKDGFSFPAVQNFQWLLEHWNKLDAIAPMCITKRKQQNGLIHLVTSVKRRKQVFAQYLHHTNT